MYLSKNMIGIIIRISLAAIVLTFVTGILTPDTVQFAVAQKRVSPTNSSTISGTAVRRSVTCPRFKLKSGETVSLAGRKRGLQPGKRFKLRGKWAAFSNCMQGRTFVVEEIVTGR